MLCNDHSGRFLRGFIGLVCAGLLLGSAAACEGSGEATPDGSYVDSAPGDSGAPTPGAPAPSAPNATTNDPTDPGAAGVSAGDPGTAAVDPAPRVVFLGTSLTAGLGLRLPAERWPEQIGALADSAGRPIEVVNAGVSGDTSAGGLRRLGWLLEDPVDLLVVELGANDGLRGQDPDALEANLDRILEQTRAAWPDARLAVVAMEAPTNLGPVYTTRFREVFPRVAARHGAAFVPFLLDGVAAVPELNQDDGIHPTAEGHRLMARNAWPVLDSLLRTLE